MKAVAKKVVRKPEPRKRAPAEPDVRRRILRASRVLIEREGLSALSMREVARRAGVSHQAPYNHFEDRAAILGALAEEGFLILRDKLIVILQSSEDTSERIRAGLRGYVEFAVQYPAHFRLMFRPELVDLDDCPGAKEAGDNVFTMFTDVVKELVKRGVPAEPSIDALIALCWSVCHGLACLILDGPLTRKLPGAEHEAIVEGVTGAFSAMLQARMKTPSRK
ncbi:MAG TPA: TetR/AcrR family transcriptional regulator [Polyangiales bacterium]|nr:TetR/AcrR family transcriptional regulator [Polyangiales bacterium]